MGALRAYLRRSWVRWAHLRVSCLGLLRWDMEALVCCDIVYLLLKTGTAAREPLLDADMMCGYVCVREPVGGTGEVCEREATLQIRPVELLCDASHELPKRMLGPELFLDVPGKKGYVPHWSCIPFCDWVVDLSNSGAHLLAVPFKNLCLRPPSLLSLPLSSLQARILIPRPVPTSRTSCHLQCAQSKSQKQPFFR